MQKKCEFSFRLFLLSFAGVFFLGNSSVFAGNILSQCEKEIVKAVSVEEFLYEDELKTFMDLRSSQADMKAKSVPLYLQTYECHLGFICEAVANPQKKEFGGGLSLCAKTSSAQAFEKYNVDFSVCKSKTAAERNGLMGLCEKFIQKKRLSSFSTASDVIIKQSSLENQSFLSSKIQELRENMKILFEKTRLFSKNFNDVIGDVNCTIPDKSGF